jgi:nicotinamide-nucleotide adenylyltransferase
MDRASALTWIQDTNRLAEIRRAIAAIEACSKPTFIILAGKDELANANHIGILAGSFNPPTQAHLALATIARKFNKLDVVVWSISRVTVDKEQITRAPLEHRLAMLTAIVATRPHEAVALTNQGLYADQATALRNIFPKMKQITFIMGYDKVVQIFDSRYYSNREEALMTLFHQANISVAPRAHDDIETIRTLLNNSANSSWQPFVNYLPLDPQYRYLSSTTIRTKIEQGEDVSDMVPSEGLALIDSGSFN